MRPSPPRRLDYDALRRAAAEVEHIERGLDSRVVCPPPVLLRDEPRHRLALCHRERRRRDPVHLSLELVQPAHLRDVVSCELRQPSRQDRNRRAGLDDGREDESSIHLGTLSELPSERRLDQPEPRDLPDVVLEVHEELGEPTPIVPCVQPSDQRRTVAIGPLEHAEQLASRRLPQRAEDPRTDGVVGPHRRSEKPPEPEGPSGFSMRTVPSRTSACQVGAERQRPPERRRDPVRMPVLTPPAPCA